MLWRVLRLFAPYWRPIAAAAAMLLIAAPIQMSPPLVWMYVVDTAIPARDGAMIFWLCALMMGIHWTGAALDAARTYLLGVAGQRFIRDLRLRLHDTLIGQSLQYHHDQRVGDQSARVMSDVDTLNEVIINGVDQALSQAVNFTWVAGIIIWLQPTIGTLTLLPLVAVAIITYVFNNYVKHIYRAIRDRFGDVSASLQEQLGGVAVIKAFARERYEQQRFAQLNQVLLGEAVRGVAARAVYFPGVTAVGYLCNAVMLGLGAWFIVRGEFTLGGLIAYRGYWWFLFFPVFTLAQTNELFQRAAAAGGRIFEILDATRAIEDPQRPRPLGQIDGKIAFDNVSFRYRAESPVLEDICFAAAPGQHIGIAGPSGAGKSTVLHLALRFYDPVGGCVRLDGHDLRTLRQEDLRRPMALVAQEPFLFEGTVRENIAFGRLDAAAEDIERAATLANAHDFISALADGYETRVGERGVKLSGGQKQRISIARAFLANPKVLLLDEATAAVEPESEAMIQSALERLMEGRTTITVSHRLSLLRNCDEILIIEQGRIVERGSHDALIRFGGWYARMDALQRERAPGEMA